MTSRHQKCMYPFKKESRKSEKFQTYTRLHTSNSKRPWQPSRSDTSGHRFIPKSLETFLINTSLKSFCTSMEYEAPLNYTSEQFPFISPAKRREISGRAPSYFEELERKCAEATPQLTPSDWDEADSARSAQIKPRAQTEETHRADRSKSPPPPWIHTGSACPSLPDKLWELKKENSRIMGIRSACAGSRGYIASWWKPCHRSRGPWDRTGPTHWPERAKRSPTTRRYLPDTMLCCGVVLMLEGARFAHLVLLDMISWRY